MGRPDHRLRGVRNTAKTGNDGADFTSETFSTSSWQIASTFGSAAASGLTVAKMIEAKRILRKAQVPTDEPKTWVTNSQGESDLLNQVQVVSTEFNDRPVLEDGKVTRFLGFDIVYSERLSSSSERPQQHRVREVGPLPRHLEGHREQRLTQRNDLSGLPYQIYTMMSSGRDAARARPAAAMLCADTSAAADVTP
jgi:hypothetical protein